LRIRRLAGEKRRPRGCMLVVAAGTQREGETRLLDFLHSPGDLLLALLFASSLALGACLWVVWSETQRRARRDQKMLRETESHLHQQLATLNEKLSGELARQRRDAEQTEHSLEAAVRRRLDELQALIESLRLLESKLQARMAPRSAEQSPGAAAKDARAGLSLIPRPPKTGSGENVG
jgi:uncharacterized protein HemX